MKKNEVEVGQTYAMKVSGDIVPVKITAEKWSGDKHSGWMGTNTKTNRGVRIKTAQRLRGEVGAAAKNERQDHEAPTAKELANNAEVEKAAKGKKPAAARLRAAITGEIAERAAKAPKPAKEKAAKRMSALDAAALVLQSSLPMRATNLIAEMEAKGLWKSPGGKTPAATLHAAITREIAAKGDEARFKKIERGVFVAGKNA